MKLLRKIKIYHLTGNWEDPNVKKIIEFFEEICNNMIEYYSDKYPISIFYKYKDKIYFELDFEDNITRCRYSDFWLIFKTKFGLKHQEIRKLTQYMLGTHLKRKLPPTWMMVLNYDGIELRRRGREHLKRNLTKQL